MPLINDAHKLKTGNVQKYKVTVRAPLRGIAIFRCLELPKTGCVGLEYQVLHKLLYYLLTVFLCSNDHVTLVMYD